MIDERQTDAEERDAGAERPGEQDAREYADTGGFETDMYYANAWRYRDYVNQVAER